MTVTEAFLDLTVIVAPDRPPPQWPVLRPQDCEMYAQELPSDWMCPEECPLARQCFDALLEQYRRMTMHIIRLGDLQEFEAEVPTGSIVRLSLTHRDQMKPNSLPSRTLELHLQGRNDKDDILWLMESHKITWLPQGPPQSREESISNGMLDLKALVTSYLEGRGYQVRAGSYGIDKDIEPVNGQFECARWSKNEDDQTWSVQLREDLETDSTS